MSRATFKIVICLAAPCVAYGCASRPSPQVGYAPGQITGQAMTVARRGAAAGAETFDVAYRGMGGALGAPLRDFNFAHRRIPAALHRAAAAPYDTTGLDSCEAVTAEIATLDLALGPDLDTPDIERTRDIYGRGASLVADAALDAVSHAALGYIPMRSVIRRVSGAAKLERRMRRAELAGAVRRGFLKAIGMQRGCGWPAAPLGSPVRIPLSPLIIARLASPQPEIVLAPSPPPRVRTARAAGSGGGVIRIATGTTASGVAPMMTPVLSISAAASGGSGSVAALPLGAHTWLQPADGR